ncbi:hypothetical protein P7C70_g2443, partial [Phenoliferia sp. Uapishka_3]
MNVLRPSNRSFCTCTPRQGVSQPPLKISRRPAAVHAKAKPPRVYKRKNVDLPPGVPPTELFLSLVQGAPAISGRPTLVNEDAARDLVREWGIDKMHDAVIVEPYAGPGGITRALLELKNVKRVISVEDAQRYTAYLRELRDKQEDPTRLALVERDPYLWESYTHIEELGLLADVPKHPWSEVHPNLFLACQLPNSRHGDQLFFQFLTAIASKMWYFQYGRFQMGFTGSNAFWNKIQAPLGSLTYHKLAVLVPALGNLEKIDLLGGLLPPERYFHKPRGDSGLQGIAKITPHENALVKNFEALEHVTRNMFISRTQSWRKGVAGLAPGAANLIPLMEAAGINQADVAVRDLTLQDWVIVADVFNAWPFRAQTLFDEGNFTELDDL